MARYSDGITEIDETPIETTAAQRIDVLSFQIPHRFRAVGILGPERHQNMGISPGHAHDFSLKLPNDAGIVLSEGMVPERKQRNQSKDRNEDCSYHCQLPQALIFRASDADSAQFYPPSDYTLAYRAVSLQEIRIYAHIRMYGLRNDARTRNSPLTGNYDQ